MKPGQYIVTLYNRPNTEFTLINIVQDFEGNWWWHYNGESRIYPYSSSYFTSIKYVEPT